MQKLQERFSNAGDLTKALAAQAAFKEDPTTETVDANIKELEEVNSRRSHGQTFTWIVSFLTSR